MPNLPTQKEISRFISRRNRLHGFIFRTEKLELLH